MNQERRTILLADNTPANARLFKGMLEKAGYDVLCAFDRDQALRTACDEGSHVDLVLMEIELGGPDGALTASEILQRRNIPIVFFSERTAPNVLERIDTIPSYGYVAKNSERGVLETSIKTAFRLHKANMKTTRERDMQREVLESALTGYWEWNLKDGTEYWSPAFKRMLGYEAHELRGSHEEWEKLIFPEDLPLAGESLEKHMRSSGAYPYYHEVRYRHKDGSPVWVICAGRIVEFDDEGAPARMAGCHIDISGRKLAEESMARLIERQQSLLATVPDIIVETDMNCVYTWANEAGLRFFGPDMIGREANHYFAGDRMTHDWLGSLFRGEEEMVCAESWQRGRDGAVRLLAWRCCALKGADGRMIGSISTARDITESAEHARNLIETSLELITTLDADGKITEANAAAERLSGYSREELVGSYGPSYFTDPERARQGFTKAFEMGQLADYPLTLRHKSGRLIEMMFNGSVYKDERGEVVGLFTTGRDITKLKRAEDALRESENRMASAFDHAPIGMAFVSPEWRWLKVNQVALRLLGYTEEELLSKRIHDITPPEDLENDLDFSRRLLQGKIETYQKEKRYVHKSGRIVWTQISVSLLRDKEGHPLHFIVQMQDIVERKKSEEQLRLAMEEAVRLRMEAEQANRAKSVFLANMSHEIRTPLNAILGFSSVLERDTSLSDRQAEQVSTINRSGRHLLRLINDILDMSRIEAGRMTLTPAPFCLKDLLDDLETTLLPRAESKGLRLSMRREGNVPRYTVGDEAKLRQVLINLMENAVKFTRHGEVTVHVGVEQIEENENDVRLVVEVQDTGPGIPEDDTTHIFDTFRQSEAGREVGGTGLGLAISKRLTELMGGHLTLRSKIGSGSCFKLRLPLEKAPSTEDAEVRFRRVAGLEKVQGELRILLVDDKQENRDILRALLEPPGFALKEAENGKEALEIVREWLPHVVLMDMRMPVMDGYEATRRIKADEKGASIPVIAVTAFAFKEDERKVLDAGADGYIRKPFRPEELFLTLSKILKIRCVYADPPLFQDASPLTAEKLVAALPAPLVADMYASVKSGNMAGLKESISRAKEIDAGISEKLLELARRYDYESLRRLLSSGAPGEGERNA